MTDTQDRERVSWRDKSAGEMFDGIYRTGWNDAIEQSIETLRSSYPGHAWLNAACACLRSLLESGPSRTRSSVPRPQREDGT